MRSGRDANKQGENTHTHAVRRVHGGGERALVLMGVCVGRRTGQNRNLAPGIYITTRKFGSTLHAPRASASPSTDPSAALGRSPRPTPRPPSTATPPFPARAPSPALATAASCGVLNEPMHNSMHRRFSPLMWIHTLAKAASWTLWAAHLHTRSSSNYSDVC